MVAASQRQRARLQHRMPVDLKCVVQFGLIVAALALLTSALMPLEYSERRWPIFGAAGFDGKIRNWGCVDRHPVAQSLGP